MGFAEDLQKSTLHASIATSIPHDLGYKFSLKTFLTVLTIVVEIAATIAVEALTLGAATPAVAGAAVAEAGAIAAASGASFGASAAIGVGIGLAGAAARTGIDAAYGELSGISVGIDFASAFLPIPIAKVGEIRAVSRLAKGLNVLKGEAEFFKAEAAAMKEAELLKLTAEHATSKAIANPSVVADTGLVNFTKATDKFAPEEFVDQLFKVSRKLKWTDINQKKLDMFMAAIRKETMEAGTLEPVDIVMTLITQFKRLQSGEFALSKTGQKILADSLVKITAGKFVGATAVAEAEEISSRLLKFYSNITNGTIVQKGARESVSGKLLWKKFRQDLKWYNMGPQFPRLMVNSSATADGVRLMSVSGGRLVTTYDRVPMERFENLFTRAGHKTLTKLEIRRNDASQALYTMLSINGRQGGLDTTSRTILWGLMDQAGYVEDAQWTKLLNAFIAQLGNREMKYITNTLMTPTYKGIKAELKDLIYKRAAIRVPWTGTRILRYLGSSKFNKWVVQFAQLIDPNDLGRMGVEFAYQKASSAIEKKIAAKYERKLARDPGGPGVASKSTKKRLKAAWEKQNGISWPMNRYIIGHKVIQHNKAPGARNIVLIKFNHLNTWSVTRAENSKTKHGGKKDIIILATSYECARFEAEGVRYWWKSENAGKGWWTSRGGSKGHRGAYDLEAMASLFLGFFPTSVFRNVGSIVSNWVENVADITNGSYAKNYQKKFLGSLERSLMNRSVRLVTRVVAGGMLKSAAINNEWGSIGQFFGRNAPRELQRWSSLTTAAMFKVDNNGNLRWAPKGIASNFKNAGMALMTSAKSAAMRAERSITSKWSLVRRSGKPGKEIVTLNGQSRFNAYAFESIKRKWRGPKVRSRSILGREYVSIRFGHNHQPIQGQIRSVQRKFNTMRRIPSSLTPSSVLNSRALGRVNFGQATNFTFTIK